MRCDDSARTILTRSFSIILPSSELRQKRSQRRKADLCTIRSYRTCNRFRFSFVAQNGTDCDFRLPTFVKIFFVSREYPVLYVFAHVKRQIRTNIVRTPDDRCTRIYSYLRTESGMRTTCGTCNHYPNRRPDDINFL